MKPGKDEQSPERKKPVDTAAHRRREELYRWAAQFAKERGIRAEDVLEAVRAHRAAGGESGHRRERARLGALLGRTAWRGGGRRPLAAEEARVKAVQNIHSEHRQLTVP